MGQQFCSRAHTPRSEAGAQMEVRVPTLAAALLTVGERGATQGPLVNA